jgi:hypothetical protein
MARDPGSLWSPLREAGTQGSHRKNKFIVHSTGDRGTAAAIFNYFNLERIAAESTFIVGRGPEDPTRQLLDSSERADANIAANDEGISVEVVGTGDDDYTDWQKSEIIRIGRWAREAHPDILPQVVPSAAQESAGYGWHVMFGAPGPWTGVAKVCPGKLRIKRLQGEIFPAIFAGAPAPAPAPTSPAPAGLLSEDTDLALYVDNKGNYFIHSYFRMDYVGSPAEKDHLEAAYGKATFRNQADIAVLTRGCDQRRAGLMADIAKAVASAKA